VLLFTLVFSMFPAAWVLALAAAGAYTVAAVRFWRRLPEGGRLLLRARLATPRLYVRLGSAALCTVVAVGVGIADAGIDPKGSDTDLWIPFAVLLLAFVASVTAVLGVDMVARPRAPGPDGAPEPPDAPLQHAAARLTWRVLRAACVPAGVLVFLSTGGAAWPVRAVVGTLLIGGYAVALARIRRGVLEDPGAPNHVLARLTGPLSVAAGTLLVFLPMGAYWPGDVPDLAEAAVLVILGVVLLGWAPAAGFRRLWRRVRPAAGRPAP
jgi:hypothetical protein